MKKVLVIGGTGTISTPCTLGLAAKEDFEVYVLNRGNKNSVLPANCKFITGDIKKDPESVKKAVEGLEFDAVISYIMMTPVDAEIHYDIFKNKTKQFIYISTVATLNHDLSCDIDEEMARGNAYSAYGRNKAAIELYLLDKYEKEGFPVTIVRPSQTYSDHRIPLSIKGKNCWSVVSRMLRGKEVIIHGDGQSVWASTHANDFAKAFVPLVTNEKTIGEIYQIMNPAHHTWDMLYRCLADLLDVEYKPVYITTDLLAHSKAYDLYGSIMGDKMFSCMYDISKVKTIVPDFKPEIDVKKGLEMYLQFMEDHPEQKVEDEAFDKWCDETIALYKECTKRFIENI